MLGNILRKSDQIRLLYQWLQMRVFNRNHVKNNGFGNKIIINKAFIIASQITLNGQNNLIILGEESRVSDLKIFIQGNDNIIKIGNKCSLRGVNLWMEDNLNMIQIGDYSTIEANTHMACIEGCKITVGEDCMFSSNINVFTGDSHSITDLNGERINPSQDIIIGNHVWVGTQTMIMKGANVPDHSIVGACSIVNKKHEIANTILAGSPAKIVKNNIDWRRERII